MLHDEKRILTINPGSTSTKIGVFHNERSIFEKTLRHNIEELQQFDHIIDQYEFRKSISSKRFMNKALISRNLMLSVPEAVFSAR